MQAAAAVAAVAAAAVAPAHVPRSILHSKDKIINYVVRALRSFFCIDRD